MTSFEKEGFNNRSRMTYSEMMDRLRQEGIDKDSKYNGDDMSHDDVKDLFKFLEENYSSEYSLESIENRFDPPLYAEDYDYTWRDDHLDVKNGHKEMLDSFKNEYDNPLKPNMYIPHRILLESDELEFDRDSEVGAQDEAGEAVLPGTGTLADDLHFEYMEFFEREAINSVLESGDEEDNESRWLIMEAYAGNNDLYNTSDVIKPTYSDEDVYHQDVSMSRKNVINRDKNLDEMLDIAKSLDVENKPSVVQRYEDKDKETPKGNKSSGMAYNQNVPNTNSQKHIRSKGVNLANPENYPDRFTEKFRVNDIEEEIEDDGPEM